ncbi:inositol monophosphatase family protein [Virgibacillus sp. W0181]|uniref:inositol monophosphatase family protein n=1 Tax=Virgibacillus sp. W0181 TaxID=3391581 RepID=UPI003F48771D
MEQSTMEYIYNKAKSWILEAGDTIRNKMNDGLIIDIKSGPKDLVTDLDKETEQFFAKRIKEEFTDHLIIGEEGYGDHVTSLDGTVWIIDPIDGTMNFVHQKRNFAISIGIYKDGIGEVGLIYNVMEDVLYSATRNRGAFKNDEKLPELTDNLILEESILALNHNWLCKNRLMDENIMQQLAKKVRGTRTYGSAALEFAYVAEGIIDGYITMRLEPWDVAAGLIIVGEVGGVTTDIEGNTINLLKRNSVFTGNSIIHHKIINDYLLPGKK